MIWDIKLRSAVDRRLVLEEPAPSILEVEAAGSIRTMALVYKLQRVMPKKT